MTTNSDKVVNFFGPTETEQREAEFKEIYSRLRPSTEADWENVAEVYKPSHASQHDYKITFLKCGLDAGFSRTLLKRIWNRAKPDREAWQEIFQRREAAQQNSLIIRNLGDVTIRSLEYIWVGWLVRGYVNLFAAETGMGKTTIVADFVARVTRGDPFPGEPISTRREPGRVIWLGSEDGMEELTVPRLMACGANLNYVAEIQGSIRDGQRVGFSLQDDIANVSSVLQKAKENGEPFAMIVLDPITSYLSGQYLRKVDMNDASQVRTVLEPWFEVAQQFQIAIVAITHFMKDTTRSMLHRVIGSAAFAQTCRSLIAVIDRSDDETPHAKAMIQVKTNLPEHPGGAWLFSTEKVWVGSDPTNGKPIHATRPHWDRLDTMLTPANLIGTHGAKSEKPVLFVGWLRQQFAKVPPNEGLPVSVVLAAAVSMGIVTEVWWNKFSGEYLEKKNIGGVWHCRPRDQV